MASYSFGENERYMKKCCPWLVESVALLIGVVGAVADLFNMLFFIKEVNLMLSLINFFTCVGLVVAHWNKIPDLYLPYLALNALFLVYCLTALVFLICGLVSGKEILQRRAIKFVCNFLGTECEIFHDSLSSQVVFLGVVAAFSLVYECLVVWVVWKAFQKAKFYASNTQDYRLPNGFIALPSIISAASEEDGKPLQHS